MKNLIKNSKIKKFIHYCIIDNHTKRARFWYRFFVYPFIIKKGKQVKIRRRARLDLIPTKEIQLGNKVIIEDYAIINNCMGDIIIGDESSVTSRVKLVGPVTLGKMVTIGSGAQITGLVHSFENIDIPIKYQGCYTSKTVVEDDVWIGGNSVIIQGIKIGTHSIIASGSVVTKNVPPYSVVAGNPARVIKQYNHSKQIWEKVSKT